MLKNGTNYTKPECKAFVTDSTAVVCTSPQLEPGGGTEPIVWDDEFKIDGYEEL